MASFPVGTCPGELESPFLDEDPLAEATLPLTSSDSSALASVSAFATELAIAEHSLSEREVVGGSDERVRVTNTLLIPYRWICAIDILTDNPKWPQPGQDKFLVKRRATGVLVAPGYMLTAKHITEGAAGYRVSPARNGDNLDHPFGMRDAAVIGTHRYEDLALLAVNSGFGAHRKSKQSVGYWGEDPAQAVVLAVGASDLEGSRALVAGYPGDTCGDELFTGSSAQKQPKIEQCWLRRNREWAATQYQCGAILTPERHMTLLYHTADTYHGQSGSPIFREHEKRQELVGLHTGERDANSNVGLYFTPKTLAEVCSWINKHAGYAMASLHKDTLVIAPRQAEQKELEDLLRAEFSSSSPVVESWFTNDFSEEAASVEANEVQFEEFVPKVSLADRKQRLDAYKEHARSEYTLPDGSKVRALPQFQMVEANTNAMFARLEQVLGPSFARRHPGAALSAGLGRPTPTQLQAVTQALIDAGKLTEVAKSTPAKGAELVRRLQQEFGVGMDCAGYVQLAFIFAFTEKHDDRQTIRDELGLKSRGNENLRWLPDRHYFKRVAVTDAEAGDLIVLDPPAWSVDGAVHAVVVYDHTVAGDEHTFWVDSSWGFMYGQDAAGVARRRWVHDARKKTWWDIKPDSGDKANENSVGPYNEHPIVGVFRAIQR